MDAPNLRKFCCCINESDGFPDVQEDSDGFLYDAEEVDGVIYDLQIQIRDLKKKLEEIKSIVD